MPEHAPTTEERAPDPPERSDGSSRNQEEMPRVVFTRRRLLASILFVASTVAFLYFVLPKLLGLKDTWNRIQTGNGWWLGLAAVLEVCSFFGYVALFRAVFIRGKTCFVAHFICTSTSFSFLSMHSR